MKLWNGVRRAFCAAAACAMMMTGAAAETPALEEKSFELGESRITWPAVTGLEDQEKEAAVNEIIQTEGRIQDYLARVSQLISGGKLTTEWTGGIYGDLVSVSFLTEGALRTLRNESERTAVNLDLEDGKVLSVTDLMKDPEAGMEALALYLEDQVAPDLSPMLLNSAVTPVPDCFRMDESGVTLLYPSEQLCTLEDRAGEIHLAWCEIREWLDESEGGIPDRMGVPELLTFGEGSAERLMNLAGTGRITGIPVTIGEKLKGLTDRYGLATDPDVYEGGRMFSLEGGCFRRVWLLTDFLSEDWEDSVVQGIRMDRGNWAGLCIGTTERKTWQMILGEPDTSVTITGEKAELNQTTPGTWDYYTCGDYQLRLQSDTEGILSSIILTE